MLAMPRSTPRNPAGSYGSGSGTSTVAYRNHMPSRWTRSRFADRAGGDCLELVG